MASGDGVKFLGKKPNVVEAIYNQVPAFTDVFDEETFYIFAMVFVMGTFLLAFTLSKFVTLKPVD